MSQKQLKFVLALLLVVEMICAGLIPFFSRFLSFSGSGSGPAGQSAPPAAVDGQPQTGSPVAGQR